MRKAPGEDGNFKKGTDFPLGPFPVSPFANLVSP